MFRLLLVDDEATIRKGMISRIDWGKYGVRVVGDAANGSLALEKALLLNPHIILTDIRMPVMDGVELARQIRAKCPACKIIVMSGYDDFAYAKSLMSMKVTEYLLKPIDENELMSAIERLIREIKEEDARRVVGRIINENLPQLKTKFMQNVLESDFSDDEDLRKRAAALNLFICTHNCEYRIVAIAIDAVSDADGVTDKHKPELIRFSVANISEELINNVASGIIGYSGSNELIGLICSSADSDFDANQLCQNIHRSLKRYLDISPCVGIGSPVGSIKNIRASYEAAYSELDEKRHSGKRSYVQIALRYVKDHFNSDISLAEVAGVAFVSPNYLSKVFKEEMKMSFVDWLNQLRVDNAKKMLLNTNLKTYEIAEKVGYKDYKYFSAIFKKTTGLLPSEYRRHPPSI